MHLNYIGIDWHLVHYSCKNIFHHLAKSLIYFLLDGAHKKDIYHKNYTHYLYFGADSTQEHLFYNHVFGSSMVSIGMQDFNNNEIQIMSI